MLIWLSEDLFMLIKVGSTARLGTELESVELSIISADGTQLAKNKNVKAYIHLKYFIEYYSGFN